MKNYSQSSDSKINLTPMLDVVFIMLIFFIVTATFVNETGLDVHQPDEQTNQPSAESAPILVGISANDQFEVNGSIVDFRLLRPILERLHAQEPTLPVVINPHPKSSTEALVRVMDSAKLVGISDIKFVRTDA